MANQIDPTDIAVNLKERQLTITWADDQVSVYSLQTLRQNCPCAVCDNLRRETNADPLRVLSPDQANASDELDPHNLVQIVGNYALQFFWADGHRTGIYTYKYLRSLG